MEDELNHKIVLTRSYFCTQEDIVNLFKDKTIFKLTGADEIEVTFNTGGFFNLIFTNRGTISGKFILASVNEIILEWNVEGFERPNEIKTLVHISLRQEGDRCTLTLEHKNIKHAEAALAKKGAWTEILHALEKKLHTGQAIKTKLI